jgi:hypothetical protein
MNESFDYLYLFLLLFNKQLEMKRMEAKVMNDMRDECQYGIVRSGKGKGKGKVSKVQSKVSVVRYAIRYIR